jgi:hypothetical protein
MNDAASIDFSYSIDSIIDLSYSLLSGPAGQARDWKRFRSLYVPGARLMPVVGGANPHVRILSVDDYINRVDPIFAFEDFYERETSREEQVIGRFAHVLSHYESLRDSKAAPFERGTNSMQLFFDDSRWWFVSIMWNTSRSA